jgi:hypothetical protein
MFERWTVDAVAGEIERQVKGAAPTPRLVRRYYKHGRKHGRKRIDPLAFRGFIVNCVDLAAAKVNKEYVAEQRALQVQVADLRARMGQIDPNAFEDPTAAGPVAVTPTAAGPEAVGDFDLSSTLGALKQRQADAELKAKSQEARGKRDALESEKDGAERTVAQAEQQLATLEHEFQQRIEGCHEVGEILWSRFRSGYIEGTTKRRRAGEDVPDIEESIDFDGLSQHQTPDGGQPNTEH